MYLFYDLFRRDPHVTHVAAGDYLFREGDDTGNVMYVLVSGSAEVLVGEQVVEVATGGSILGEMALAERRECRSASVLARTHCSFVVIDEKRFHYLVTEVPQFAIEVMRVLARRLRTADKALKRAERHTEDSEGMLSSPASFMPAEA